MTPRSLPALKSGKFGDGLLHAVLKTLTLDTLIQARPAVAVAVGVYLIINRVRDTIPFVRHPPPTCLLNACLSALLKNLALAGSQPKLSPLDDKVVLCVQ